MLLISYKILSSARASELHSLLYSPKNTPERFPKHTPVRSPKYTVINISQVKSRLIARSLACSC